RNHIPAAGPLAKINQAAAVAAERKVRIRGLGCLPADRASKFDRALARHTLNCGVPLTYDEAAKSENPLQLQFRDFVVEKGSRGAIPDRLSPPTPRITRSPPLNHNHAPP